MKLGIFRKSVVAFLTVATIILGVTPVEHNGQLKVDITTGKVVNKNNYPIQLRGMSSHGLQWYPEFMNPTAFAALRDNWGADIVRLSMYIQEDGYETNPTAFTTLMDNLINQVTAAGLYVLVDFHQLNPGDPNANIEYAKTFFAHIAQTHAAKNNIFYEICNEPNSETGTVTWSMIKTYANTIIPIIRQYDSHNIVVVGTPEWDQRPDQVINSRVSDDNVLYTVHFYAAEHKDMSAIKAAVAAKLPLIITECGTQAATGDGANDFTSSKTWFDYLDANKISWVNWNFSSDERSGAVFASAPSNYSDAAYYTSTSSLKEAGLWIKERMKMADDWGSVIIDTTPYQVSVIGGTGSGLYRQGEKVTITASAGGDSLLFSRWNGDASKVVGTFDSVAVFTMTNTALTFTAEYTTMPVWSENLLGMNGTWNSLVDTKGSTAEVDSSAQDSSITLALTLIRKGTLAEAALTVDGDYSNFSMIQIRYSTDKAVSCIISTTAGNYVTTLPASEDTTIQLNISDFVGNGTIDPTTITSIGFAATAKSSTTMLTISDIRISSFIRAGTTGILKNKSDQLGQFTMNMQSEKLSLSGINTSAPVNVSIYSLTGRLLYKSIVGSNSSALAMAIPADQIGAGVSILTVTNGSLSLTQKFLLK